MNRLTRIVAQYYKFILNEAHIIKVKNVNIYKKEPNIASVLALHRFFNDHVV